MLHKRYLSNPQIHTKVIFRWASCKTLKKKLHLEKKIASNEITASQCFISLNFIFFKSNRKLFDYELYSGTDNNTNYRGDELIKRLLNDIQNAFVYYELSTDEI